MDTSNIASSKNLHVDPIKTTMIDQIKIFWKKLLSYSKTKWEISDYPLRYKKQIDATEQYNVGELKPWVVQVINWWTMTGVGNTKQEAYKHLSSNFKTYLEHYPAPRPGTNIPLSFADTSQVDDLEDVAADFFEKILNLNYYECFISDESRISDFGKDDEETLQKLNEIYGIRLTEFGDGNIVTLLSKIRTAIG
jgi:hypothetical protein